MRTYKVYYTNKKGKRTEKIVKATTADNAYMYVDKTLGGKYISVNWLRGK